MPRKRAAVEVQIEAVLAHLSRPDLQQARMACRAFDAASRSLISDTITLTPKNVEPALEADAPLDWSRFPGVRALRLLDWGTAEELWVYLSLPDDHPLPAHVPLLDRCLRTFFGGWTLPAVVALHLNGSAFSGRAAARLVRRLPNLEAVKLTYYAWKKGQTWRPACSTRWPTARRSCGASRRRTSRFSLSRPRRRSGACGG